MNSPNPQHEPTMEEILASIRKIISEDQPDAGKPVQPPQAVAEAPLPPDPDVLDLTEEFREAEPEPMQPMVANDVVFEPLDEPAPQSHMDEDDGLISNHARDAMGRAFANFDYAPAAAAPAVTTGGTLDALFTHAIQDSFGSILHDWVNDHHAEIMDQLKPMIRTWMDQNLPQLIETAVARELSRVSPVRRR